MIQRVVEAAQRAGRYQSFAEFLTQVILSERKQFGWVDSKFYELWPGGRCVEWTKHVTEGVTQCLKEPDFASDGTRAKYIIDYVRDIDGGEKPW